MNFFAPINTLGYGVFSTNLLAALSAAGADPALFPIGPIEAAPKHHPVVRQALARAERFDPAAACLKIWHPNDLATRVGRGAYGAYAFFETDALTSLEAHHVRSADLVFASSEWARGVLANAGVEPRRTIKACPGVDASIFHPAVPPAPLTGVGPETCVFLSAGKWSLNKGHDFLLESFNKAFVPDDDVLLVTACFNPLVLPGFDGPGESAKWASTFALSPMGRAGKVRCLPGRLASQEELAALMAAADCGVFLSRGEGWDLEAAEVLAMGRPVVATNVTAHREFCRGPRCRLVEAPGLEPADDGVFFRGVANWALLDADALDQAVARLRAVHAEKKAGALRPDPAAGAAFAAEYSWAGCAAAVLAGFRGAAR